MQIVIFSDYFLGVFGRQAPMRVQALLTELPVERLDEPVVRGLARLAEVAFHAAKVRPTNDNYGVKSAVGQIEREPGSSALCSTCKTEWPSWYFIKP
jgi:hypothetical protein